MVVILQCTARCNLQCEHCFASEIKGTMFLSDATTVLQQIPPQSTVVFHGGEPTLLGVEYYKTLINRFPSLRFSMQTNLYNIDEKWCDFFAKILNGRVSTSFDITDGPAIRPLDTNKWLQNIKLLRLYGIRPYVVSTLGKMNEHLPAKQFFDFFNKLGLSFRLNVIENLGRARKNYPFLRHTPGRYASLLVELFDLWFCNPSSCILIDPLAEILEHMIQGSSHRKCPFTSRCAQDFIAVTPVGDVYPCGGFYLSEFRYGNLLYDDLTTILKHPQRLLAMKRYLNLPDECHRCEFLHICQGGCRLEAYSHSGNLFDKTSICEEYKIIFSHIKKRISETSNWVDWWEKLYTSRTPFKDK